MNFFNLLGTLTGNWATETAEAPAAKVQPETAGRKPWGYKVVMMKDGQTTEWSYGRTYEHCEQYRSLLRSQFPTGTIIVVGLY